MHYKNMGELIQEKRKLNNMTQKELAEKLNISDKAVSKWERGLSCPDVTSISTLADALKIPSEQLLTLITDTKEENKTMDKTEFKKVMGILPKAIALAMGVSTFTLSVIGDLSQGTAATLLSLGLTAVGIALFQMEKK